MSGLVQIDDSCYAAQFCSSAEGGNVWMARDGEWEATLRNFDCNDGERFAWACFVDRHGGLRAIGVRGYGAKPDAAISGAAEMLGLVVGGPGPGMLAELLALANEGTAACDCCGGEAPAETITHLSGGTFGDTSACKSCRVSP